MHTLKFDDVPTCSARAIHDFHGFPEQSQYRSLPRSVRVWPLQYYISQLFYFLPFFSGDYWTTSFKEVRDCMLPYNTTDDDVERCNLYVSVCKTLNATLCGGIENSTTCQEVILKNTTKVYFDMGTYKGNGEFSPLGKLMCFDALYVH